LFISLPFFSDFESPNACTGVYSVSTSASTATSSLPLPAGLLKELHRCDSGLDTTKTSALRPQFSVGCLDFAQYYAKPVERYSSKCSRSRYCPEAFASTTPTLSMSLNGSLLAVRQAGHGQWPSPCVLVMPMRIHCLTDNPLSTCSFGLASSVTPAISARRQLPFSSSLLFASFVR
jgi:hypothetical protein